MQLRPEDHGVIFLGRCYVPTHRGVVRASATIEEMEKMPVQHVLRPLSYSVKRSQRKTSRNRKSTYRGLRAAGMLNLSYEAQMIRYQERLLKAQRRANKA